MVDPAMYSEKIKRIRAEAKLTLLTHFGDTTAVQPSGSVLLPRPTEERQWENSLDLFAQRAIMLGEASVQYDLANRLRKMSLAQKDKEDSKMDVDQPFSSTISTMIKKEMKSEINSLRKLMEFQLPPVKGKSSGKVESKSRSAGPSKTIDAHSSPLTRESHKRWLEEAETGWIREGEREGKVWEEVRELKQQVRNLDLAGKRELPDMYLEMSEQARKIYLVGMLRENECMGIGFQLVFKSVNTYLPHDIDRFLCLNSKFVLHKHKMLDSDSLYESWSEVERLVHWRYFFRNKNSSDYNPELYVKSDLYPTEVDPIVQEGLDNTYRELYNQ